MKKIILFSLFLVSLPFSLYAQSEQKVATLKAGTIVDVEAVSTVYARDVDEGDKIDFRVRKDVKVGSDIVIPSGTQVEGAVTLAAKSSLAGTKGKLKIDIWRAILPDGTIVRLSGKVSVAGKNRTPMVVVLTCLCWPCIFIPGSKAVMTEGYRATATVDYNTEITLN